MSDPTDFRQCFPFTFSHLRWCFEQALSQSYSVVTCDQFATDPLLKNMAKVLVNRVDIDVSPFKAQRIAAMFDELGIKGTFFVRLHAHEYNPFQFEVYRCLKLIRDSGHEIGLHTETIEASQIWEEEEVSVLKRDLRILEDLLDVRVKGTASHGGKSGLNNLDFWKNRRPSDFGLAYEAYDKELAFGLFDRSLYVSDSSWTHWKCHENGILDNENRLSLGEHLKAGRPLVYSLIHPETYYERHPYE